MSFSKLTIPLLAVWLGTIAIHAQEAVLRITQEEALRAAISKPQPAYPPIARQLKIQGRVEVEISINPTGSVDDVKILTGNATLTGAAANAVRNWRFAPFTSSGKPVRAVAVMAFSFKP